MTPGIHTGLSRQAYRALPHLTQSTIKKWIELGGIPSEFLYWLKNPSPASEAQILGDALDSLVLGKNEFAERFFIMGTKVDRRTKDGKQAWSEAIADAGDRTVLTLDQAASTQYMRDALIVHESSRDVFKHCHKAALVGSLWGIDVKAEVDLWNPKTDHILDLKSCRDVSARAFRRDFIEYGYHYQAVFYMRLAAELGVEKKCFDFVCVKNSPPWTVKVYTFSPYDNNFHSALYQQSLEELKGAAEEVSRRLFNDDFRDTSDWEVIDIPRYAIRPQYAYE